MTTRRGEASRDKNPDAAVVAAGATAPGPPELTRIVELGTQVLQSIAGRLPGAPNSTQAAILEDYADRMDALRSPFSPRPERLEPALRRRFIP
jgi:hypothetical protein